MYKTICKGCSSIWCLAQVLLLFVSVSTLLPLVQSPQLHSWRSYMGGWCLFPLSFDSQTGQWARHPEVCWGVGMGTDEVSGNFDVQATNTKIMHRFVETNVSTILQGDNDLGSEPYCGLMLISIWWRDSLTSVVLEHWNLPNFMYICPTRRSGANLCIRWEFHVGWESASNKSLMLYTTAFSQIA